MRTLDNICAPATKDDLACAPQKWQFPIETYVFQKFQGNWIASSKNGCRH